MERLDKFLCDSGVGTRSQVKMILKAGRVAVDGKVITGCGMGAAMQFGGALIRMMKGAEKEEAILSAILADRV